MSESLNDAILNTWFEFQGELQAVIDKHKLTAAQIRDFAADPMVRKTLDDYEALLARRQRIHAMSHQHNAAEMLSKSMFEAGSTIECRRAATVLARLTRDMLRTATSTARGGEGGVHEPASTSTAPTPSPFIEPEFIKAELIEADAPRVPDPSSTQSAISDTSLPSTPVEPLNNPHRTAAHEHPATPNHTPIAPPIHARPATNPTHRQSAKSPCRRSSDPPSVARTLDGS